MPTITAHMLSLTAGKRAIYTMNEDTGERFTIPIRNIVAFQEHPNTLIIYTVDRTLFHVDSAYGDRIDEWDDSVTEIWHAFTDYEEGHDHVRY